MEHGVKNIRTFFNSLLFISDEYPSTSVCTNYCINHDLFDEVDAYSSKENYSNSSCHISSFGTPFCHCQPGFSGSRCQINKCHNFCLNGGKCIFESNQPTCDCPTDFYGAQCQIETHK